MTADLPPDPALDARFKELASCVSAEDWEKLVSVATERLLQRLASTGMFDEATPQQLQQAHLLVGRTLVDFANVAITTIAEAQLRAETGR